MAPTADEALPSTPESGTDPEFDYAFAGQVDRVELEKQAARDAPDISWRAWWFHSGSKWYVIVGFLILDVWLFSLALGYVPLLVLLVALALYGEFLLYRYLYYVPDPDEPRRMGGFRRSWTRPVEYGRWTPEGAAVRAGRPAGPTEPGPDPKEFL